MHRLQFCRCGMQLNVCLLRGVTQDCTILADAGDAAGTAITSPAAAAAAAGVAIFLFCYLRLRPC